MAKPLNERIASALANDRGNDTFYRELIDEATAQQEREVAGHSAASAESIDFALSDEDREEAANRASRHSRNAAGLAKAIEQLDEKLRARQESDTRKAAEAERNAALAERDKLAEEFAEFIPSALDRMVDLFKAVGANEDRMRRAGLNEATAEAKARGVEAFLGYGGQPESYRKMKIPAFSGAGRMWPIDDMARMSAQVAEDYSRNLARQKRNHLEEQERKRKAAEEYAEKHGQYHLSTGLTEGFVRLPDDLVRGSLPKVISSWGGWKGEVAHEIAAELAKVSCLNVERLDGAQVR